MNDTYKLVSLFSGAGGFDWGFHLSSKYETILANELRKAPAETLARNLKMNLVSTPAYPAEKDLHLMINGDIAEINFSNINGFSPNVLIGGPPCQDFSVVKADKRQGLEVKRGLLYLQFIRAAIALQPEIFVFENVPGIMSANKGKAYNTILSDFSNLNLDDQVIKETSLLDNGDLVNKQINGYAILYSGIVSAVNVGIPQTRRRLIIIGLRQDLADKVGLILQNELKTHLKAKMEGEDHLFRIYPLTPLEVFEGKPLPELFYEYQEIMGEYTSLIENPPTARTLEWKNKVWDNLTLDIIKDYITINKINRYSNSELERAFCEHEEILKLLGYLNKPVTSLTETDKTAKVPRESEKVMERMMLIPPGENCEAVRGTPWQVEGRGISLIYRRAFPLKPAPTVVAYGGGGTWNYHYKRGRSKLSNRERARIQTFTDDFDLIGTEGEIRSMLGEAVPPLLALRISQALIECLSVVK